MGEEIMKFKKIMMLAIFLVSLLAISAVSAADNATSDVVSVENNVTGDVVSVEETTDAISVEEADEVVSVNADYVNKNDTDKLSVASDDIEKDATSQFKHEAFTIQSPLVGGTYTVNESMSITVNREKWIATYRNGYLQNDYNYIFLEIIKEGAVEKNFKIYINPPSSSNVGYPYESSFAPTQTGEYCVRVGFATPDMGKEYGYDHISQITDINYVGNFTFNVVKYQSPYKLLANDVVKYYGGSEKYTVTLTNKDVVMANAKVKISIDGKAQTVKTNSKGQASVDLNLGVGNHDVVAEYEDAKHTSKVTVKSTITASDMTGTYSNSKATATFLNTAGKALANTKVTFKIGTSSYSATTNSNGAASASIPLGVGTYTVTAVNPTNNEEKQFKLTISKADSKIALVSSQNNGFVTLTATLTPEAATGNVVFNVNGEDKSAAIKNGKATLTLSNLEPGDYYVSASYNGDKNLKASASNAVTFNVAEVYPILTADSVTKTYGTSTKLVVNLVDSKGNAIANADVNVVINGQVTPITTDSSGQATMSINKAPGSYTAAIAYADAQTTAKITVKKATPKLTAKAKTFKKSVKTKKYTVTLKTNQNKVMKNTKVTLKVNGKTYSAKTNAKGQATFKITKLTKKGKFNAVVTYKGNAYYNKLSKKVQIKIN